MVKTRLGGDLSRARPISFFLSFFLFCKPVDVANQSARKWLFLTGLVYIFMQVTKPVNSQRNKKNEFYQSGQNSAGKVITRACVHFVWSVNQ